MAVGLGGLVLGLEKKSVEEWNIFLYVSFDFWMFVIIVFLGLGVSKPMYGRYVRLKGSSTSKIPSKKSQLVL